MSDKFTTFAIVVDRNGREHKVYPALLKHKEELRYLTPKFDDTFILLNFLTPKVDENGRIETDFDDNVEYSDNAYEAMMEVLVMAFNHKYKKEEIESFIDIAMIPKILEVFYDLSGYQKKNNDGNIKDVEWDTLYASLLQNTSLNMKDIMALSIPQLEMLIDGISKNNQKAQEIIDGNETGDAKDLLTYLDNNNGDI